MSKPPADFSGAVAEAAAKARTEQAERRRLEDGLRRPSGRTPAERNAQRLDMLLRRVLPPNAAGALQFVLDRALDTLYGEFNLNADEVRSLLKERREVGRFAVTPIERPVVDALAYLSDVIAGCEEAPDKLSGRVSADAGFDSDSLISGRAAARGRKKGSREAGARRSEAASGDHDVWVKAAQRRLDAGMAQHNVSSAIARQFDVSPRAIRDVLQQRGVIKKRK